MNRLTGHHSEVPPSPLVRDFLVRLEDLLDAKDLPALDRDAVTVTEGRDTSMVRLVHPDDRLTLVLVIEDKTVTVSYGPEHIAFTDRDEALQFTEMLLDGRVELVVDHYLVGRTLRSYRDGLAVPFRRTREPWLSLRLRTEHFHFGFV